MPKNTPIKERKAEDFLAAIADQMVIATEFRGDADTVCVFALLNGRISAGEVEDIRSNLPGDIRALWPAP